MPVPPGCTTTPDLWLKGDIAYNAGTTQATDGQTVATWPDQSGNGRDALAGTAPVWKANQVNGHAAILFTSASSQYMTNAYTGELGSCFVVYANLTVGAWMGLLGSAAAAGQNGAYYFQACGLSGTQNQTLFQRSDTGDTGTLQAKLGNTVLNAWNILCGRVDPGATNKVRFYKHNILCSTVTGTTALKAPTSPTIGCDWFNGSRVDFMNGYIAEILVYNTNLSDAEFANVIAYLESRFALSNSLLQYVGVFFQRGTLGVGGESLYVVTSANDAAMKYLPSDYLPTSGNAVRDPSIIYLTSQAATPWWVCHTNKSGQGPTTTSFDVASAVIPNGLWTYIDSVDCSSVTGNTANSRCWAPQWFPDSTAPQGCRVYVSLSSTGNSGFQIYEVHPTNAAFTTWSAPVQVVGSGLPSSIIDPAMIQVGGTFYLWYKDTTTNFIGVLSSTTSITSGYTVAESGNWAGWGQPNEGASPINANSSGTGGNNWRTFFDDTATNIFYSDSTTGIIGTYNTKTAVTGPFINGGTLQHGSMVLGPLPGLVLLTNKGLVFW